MDLLRRDNHGHIYRRAAKASVAHEDQKDIAMREAERAQEKLDTVDAINRRIGIVQRAVTHDAMPNPIDDASLNSIIDVDPTQPPSPRTHVVRSISAVQ